MNSSLSFSSNYYYCYLLRSLETPKSQAGYVGFTTNPAQRLKQHNGELKNGGARRTSMRRPWKFVCIVSGFPNKIVALQFEWQWQHIQRSRLFKTPPTAEQHTEDDVEVNTSRKRKKGSSVETIQSLGAKKGYMGKIMILSHLLSHPLWKQLHLMIYFLDKEIEDKFYKLIPPTTHTICEISMDVVRTLQSEKKSEIMSKPMNSSCPICKKGFHTGKPIANELELERTWKCTHCHFQHHLVCSAKQTMISEDKSILSDGGNTFLVPSYGKCDNCHFKVKWCDLIRKYLVSGCDMKSLSQDDDEDLDDDESVIASDHDDDFDDDDDHDKIDLTEDSVEILASPQKKVKLNSTKVQGENHLLPLKEEHVPSPLPSFSSSQPLFDYYEDENEYFYHQSFNNNDYRYSIND